MNQNDKLITCDQFSYCQEFLEKQFSNQQNCTVLIERLKLFMKEIEDKT